jgi:hypothetical protein
MLNSFQEKLRVSEGYIELDAVDFVVDSVLISTGVNFVFVLLFVRIFHGVNVPDEFNCIGFRLFEGFNKLLYSSLLTVLAFHLIHRVH